MLPALPFILGILLSGFWLDLKWRRYLGVALCLFVLFQFSLVPRGASGFSVVTLNVDSWYGDLGQVDSYLRRASPELCLLQEVWEQRHFRRLLSGTTGYHYLRQDGVKYPELYILSRNPIRRVELPAAVNGMAGFTRIGETEVLVVNLHRMRLRDDHHQTLTQSRGQVAVLLKALEAQNGPVIIGGDLNLPPNSLACRQLASRFRDTYQEEGSGLGWTFPAFLPLWRLDYIFVSRGFGVQYCSSFWAGGDHRGIRVGLIPPGEQAKSANRTGHERDLVPK